MKTSHQIIFDNSKRMNAISSGTIALVVTSPPYPMIAMWDQTFAAQDPAVGKALDKKQGPAAFELMHRVLDKVWDEVYRILAPGGLACINIGDATRTLNDNFALYQNHTRIMAHLLQLGFSALPAILWRKPTNSPTKFMGSGMLPPGAYVTLEHEFVLIVRKGPKREFKTFQEKQLRRESAFFWEERNAWCSDIWLDLKGTPQNLLENKIRRKSAAYPFQIPYRLINMFSIKNDTVLDPFLGTGTTMFAAMVAGRNSIGFELAKSLQNVIHSHIDTLVTYANATIEDRIRNHLNFVQKRRNHKKALKHINENYGFPVMTRQETVLLINRLRRIKQVEKNTFQVSYSDKP